MIYVIKIIIIITQYVPYLNYLEYINKKMHRNLDIIFTFV